MTVEERPRGIVFFDIDGTLVPGSSGRFIAQRMGRLAEVDHIESAYDHGEIDNFEACDLDAGGWAGFAVADVTAWLVDLPLITGVPETLHWCREHRLSPRLTSLAWSIVGGHLTERFGFDGWCGPELHVRDGTFTGGVAHHLDEFGKRDAALAAARTVGVVRCAAVGDSRSDLPLFDAVDFAIALNGSDGARATATTAVDTDDLRDVIAPLSAWLDAESFRPGSGEPGVPV